MSDIVLQTLAIDKAQQRRALRITRARRVIASCVLAATVLSSTLVALPGVAGAVSPKLTITPSTIYYPCNEGNVTFAVKRFGADRKVKLYLDSTEGPKVAVIITNASGGGSTVLDFSNTMPGYYYYFAVQGEKDGELGAGAPLNVDTCP